MLSLVGAALKTSGIDAGGVFVAKKLLTLFCPAAFAVATRFSFFSGFAVRVAGEGRGSLGAGRFCELVAGEFVPIFWNMVLRLWRPRNSEDSCMQSFGGGGRGLVVRAPCSKAPVGLRISRVCVGGTVGRMGERTAKTGQ